MRRLRDLFPPLDRARYLAWRAAGSPGILEVGLGDGRRLAFRSPATTDAETAYELLLADAYRRPADVPDRPARRVVDLGGNVGYSILLWAWTWPDCRVLAFEPHPVQLEVLYRNVVANRLTDRVQVVASAAGARDRLAYLTDDGSSSSVVDQPGPGRVPIRVCDFFRELEVSMPGPVDLLKIDIEGGEYELMADDRFAAVDAATLIVEWHKTAAIPDGRAWCTDRLRSLGYSVAPGAMQYDHAGLLWAWR